MTITDPRTEVAPNAPEWHSWTRHTWLAIWGSVALAVLLVAALLVGVRLKSLDEEYGPVSTGPFGGGADSGIAYDRHHYARLVTKGGRTAHTYSSLDVSGAHSVRITGIDLDDVTVKAEWAPEDENAEVFSERVVWRTFPAVIDAHTRLQLRYTIRRPPSCQDKPMRPGIGTFYTDDHVVRWESLLDDHHTRTGSSSDLTHAIQIC